jgi:carbon-monoxide dehydrogenase medium subunit
VTDARVALGCVGPKPRRLQRLEARLRGAHVSDLADDPADAVDGAGEAIEAIADLHGSADYKREMARVFCRRALRVAARRARGEPAEARYPHTVAVVA